MRWNVVLTIVCLVFSAWRVRADEPSPPTADEIRKAVEKSLPIIEEKGLAWIKSRNCSSCHTFTFTVWSHVEARRHGLKVDDAKLNEWIEWGKTETRGRRDSHKLLEAAFQNLAKQGLPAPIVEKLKPMKDQTFPTSQEFEAAVGKVLTAEELSAHRAAIVAAAFKRGDGGGLDNCYQWLLGGAVTAGKTPDPEWRAELLGFIRGWQEPDGAWHAQGQFQRTPEQTLIATSWIVLALSSVDGLDAETKTQLEKGIARLKEAKWGSNTESLSLRALVEGKFGGAEKGAAARADLRKRQNSDGGFARKEGYDSEAFTTGQALYALASGKPNDDDRAAIAKAQRFLISTQGKDGSWNVPPKLVTWSEESKFQRLEPIYRHWGTAWGAIGLLQTLPMHEGKSR